MNNNIYWGGADHLYCGYCGKGPGHADDCTRPQPTASVDAEQVWNAAVAANLATPDEPYGASADAAIAVIKAYGDARADAARREALEEAARMAEGRVTRLEPLADLEARMIAKLIRAVKENPNAG